MEDASFPRIKPRVFSCLWWELATQRPVPTSYISDLYDYGQNCRYALVNNYIRRLSRELAIYY